MESLKNKRILVTGGCGFIGSHLTKRLKAEGATLLVFSRESPSACFRLKGVKCRRERVSLTDAKKVRMVIKKFRPHFVFHLAAFTAHERSQALFEPAFQVNVVGTKNLIEALSGENHLRRFIHLGTIEEYGRGRPPFRESDREHPVSPYSVTKLCATRLVEYFAKAEDFPAIILRPPLVYGPAQGWGMFIPDFIRACLKKEDFRMTRGTQTRDFLYVEDLVEGLIRAALRPGIEGEIVNLGSGKEIPIREVAMRVNKLFHEPIKIHFGAKPFRRAETMHFWLDTKKARTLFNWRPAVDLREGLRRTITWYRSHGDEIPK